MAKKVYEEIDLDLDQDTINKLLTIYEKECPEEEKQRLKLQWAAIRVLEDVVNNKEKYDKK